MRHKEASDRYDALAEELRKGTPKDQICRNFSISPSVLRVAAYRGGLGDLYSRRKNESIAKAFRVVKMRLWGSSVREIREETGLTRQGASMILKVAEAEGLLVAPDKKDNGPKKTGKKPGKRRKTKGKEDKPAGKPKVKLRSS